MRSVDRAEIGGETAGIVERLQCDRIGVQERADLGLVIGRHIVGLETLYDPDGLSEYFRTLY